MKHAMPQPKPKECAVGVELADRLIECYVRRDEASRTPIGNRIGEMVGERGANASPDRTSANVPEKPERTLQKIGTAFAPVASNRCPQ